MNINDVRKLVNDKGELHFTEAQAPDVRKAITKYVKRYQSRFDAKKITSGQIRKVIGFNTNQIFIDGNKAAVDKVTQVLKGNVANVGFGKSKFVRDLQLDLQTPKSEIVTQVKPGSDARKRSGALLPGQEDHHVRFRTLFDPFYRHLSEADQIKLTDFLLSEGFAIGNTVENLVGVDKDLHANMHNTEAIHKWAIDNNIQVTKGNPGYTNWVRDKKGNLKAIRGGAKGTSGSALNARMPNLDHITNVNEMQVLLGQYVELINEPLENHTAKILHQQDVRRYGEGSPQVRSIDSIKQNFINERDRIAAEYQLLKGDDARYFDASGKKKFNAVEFLKDRSSWYKPYLKGGLLSSTVASTLKGLPGQAANIAKGILGPEDLLGEEVLGNVGDAERRIREGESVSTVLKEEAIDTAGELKNQAMIGTGIAVGAKLTGTGAALGTVFNPVTVTPLLAWAAYRGIDEGLERSGRKGLTRRYSNFLNMYETKDPETGLGTGEYEKDPDLEKEKWDKMRTYFENRNKSN